MARMDVQTEVQNVLYVQDHLNLDPKKLAKRLMAFHVQIDSPQLTDQLLGCLLLAAQPQSKVSAGANE